MKRKIFKGVLILLLVAAAFALYAGKLQMVNNFHVVVENEVYRSGQLSADEIAEYKDKYGIKSILNLRGQKLNKDWYVAEIAESKRLGIEHIDFRMSAKQELDEKQLKELLDVMKNAPKPMLIHCMSGSDRTGLAAAFYLAGVKKAPEEVSESQLSVYYGHFYLIFNGPSAMDNTFEKFEEFLGYYGS
jgi:protein tyrosine/serine phosphatase